MGRFLAVETNFHNAELLGIESRPENGKSSGRELYIQHGERIAAVNLFPPGAHDEANSVKWDRVDLGDVGPHNLDGSADEKRIRVHGVGSIEVTPKSYNGHSWTAVVIESPNDEDYSWDKFTITVHH